MNITDAQNILAGSDNAATEYFRKNSTQELVSVIKPIIKESMSKANVAKYYQMFQSFYKSNSGVLQNKSISALSKKFGLDSYLPSSKDEDLDGYVTNQAINGLMTMIAEKEKDIRANPLIQNSNLLKKVFSAF
jgi:Ca2+-binding EF-hand superfamily protein